MRKSLIIIVVFVGMFFWGAKAGAATSINPYSGRLVKTKSHSAVYYVDQDGYRHAFPNEKIYNSWYQDFSAVEEIPAFDLAGYPLGKNIMYRPGSRLIKISSVPEVYAVEPGGILRNIPSEESAIILYGDTWSKQVDDIDIAFFFDYTIGGIIDVVDGTPIFPVGTVLSFDGTNYLMDKRTDGIFLLRQITDPGWNNNNIGQLPRRVLTNNKIREFAEYGLPLILPEARFGCVHCGNLSIIKKNVNSTVDYTSDNEKFSMDIPVTWEADSDSVNPLVVVVEGSDQSKLDGFAENLFIMSWDASEYNDLDHFLNVYQQSMELGGFTVHYLDHSNYSSSGADAVSINFDGYVNWSHFELKENKIYQLQFTGWLDDFGTYTDILHLIFTTTSINPLIPD